MLYDFCTRLEWSWERRKNQSIHCKTLLPAWQTLKAIIGFAGRVQIRPLGDMEISLRSRRRWCGRK